MPEHHHRPPDDQNAELSDNPASPTMSVTLSVPQTVKVRMVEATALADYEILFFISSLLGSAVVGFLIAAIQANAEQRTPYICFTTVLAVLFLLSVSWTLWKRHLLTKKSDSIAISYVPAQSIKPARRSARRKKPKAADEANEPPPEAVENDEGATESDPGK